MFRVGIPGVVAALLLSGCSVKDKGYVSGSNRLLEQSREAAATPPLYDSKPSAKTALPPSSTTNADQLRTLPTAAVQFITRFERLNEAGQGCQTALVADYPDLALGAFRALTRSGNSGTTASQLANAWSQAFNTSVLQESESIRKENTRGIAPLLKELSAIEQGVESQALTPQTARGHLERLRRIEAALTKWGERFHAEDAAQLAMLLGTSVIKPGETPPVRWNTPRAPTAQQDVTRAILECGAAIRQSRIKEAQQHWWRAMKWQATAPSPVTLHRMEELRDFVGEINTGDREPSQNELLETLLELTRKLLARNEAPLAARFARQAQQLARQSNGEESANYIQAQLLLARSALQSGETRNTLALAVLAEKSANQRQDPALLIQAKSLQADVLFVMRRMPRARILYRDATEIATAAALHEDAARMTLNEAKAALQEGDVAACRELIQVKLNSGEPLGAIKVDYDWLGALLESYSNGVDSNAIAMTRSFQLARATNRYDLVELFFQLQR